ncbi:MAG TPA: hypothetical protein VK636_11975 [Gemmatimonadaceae bacterium]|nr:hypothetical protein [Gemmatimonadaceae bacterium]
MNDTAPSATKDAAKLRRSIGRIGLEVMIGFIGVYAAFALNAYHERRELADRRRQVKLALIAEIVPLTELSRRNIGGYASVLAAFDSGVKAGRKPIPHPFTEPIGLNMHIWEATKQAGGLSLFDVPTFAAVADFYNDISRMLAIYGQLRELSIGVILPGADRGADAFYDARSGILRADIRRLYYWDLNALENISKQTARQGDQLIKRLAHDTL